MTLQEFSKSELKKDRFYFVLPWGIGDAVIVSGYRRALEKRLGGKIHFLVKPQHSLIMDMFRINEYTSVELKTNSQEVKDMLSRFGRNTPVPTLGEIYVAHPDFLPDGARFSEKMAHPGKAVKFLDWYREFLGLAECDPWDLPSGYPPVSKQLREKLAKVTDCPLEKVVLLLPEANSSPQIRISYWHDVIKEAQAAGKVAVTNIMDPKNCPGFEQLPNIDLTLEELLQFGIHCESVYALRSGICDLLFSRGAKLHVFYATEPIFDVFSLNTMFSRRDIDEKIVYDSSQDVYRPIVVINASTAGVRIKRFYFLGLNILTIRRRIR